MFDLITGTNKRPLRERTLGPKVISLVVHALVVTLVIVVPLLRVTNTLPPMPESIVAFVPTAPPPPPPPPPAAAPKAATPPATRATAPANPLAAPVVAPSEIAPEVNRVASAG